MLQDMLKALDDDNGVTQDIWAHIVAVMGDDSAIKFVQTYGGRYYLMPHQKHQLREKLPFMAGVNLDKIGGGTLALPAHEPEPDWGCRKCGFVVSRVSDGAFMAYNCVNDQCSYYRIKIRYTIEKPLRCGRCKGPFHPATGHQFSADVVACGICYGKFAAWQLSNKFGHRFLTNKQLKKFKNSDKKKRKEQEKAGRALALKIAREAAEAEKFYGPVEPWYPPLKLPGLNPIWER